MSCSASWIQERIADEYLESDRAAYANPKMHLFSCVMSTKTCNSLVSTSSSANPLAEGKLQISGQDQSWSAVTNHKRNGKNNLGRELRINYAVGNAISGILHKWVNFGKGWSPRWFVLQDGVLSYYKIQGPDKIVLNTESVKGSRVIGDESMKWILRQHINNHHNRHRNGNNTTTTSKKRKEIHLKVAYIGESQPDDKKFSIFTGMKWLHLRAKTKEDRTTWMEAFHAVKDMLPKMPKSAVIAPIEDVADSTDKLKRILAKQGLNVAAVQEIEQIMKKEFASLQNQLILLKQKHWVLEETLRQSDIQVKSSRKTILKSNIISSSVSANNCGHGGVLRSS